MKICAIFGENIFYYKINCIKTECNQRSNLYPDSLIMPTVLNPNLIAIYEIALYDIAGKQIVKNSAVEPSSKHEINTAQLAEGVYIIKIKSNANAEFAQKIIISRI